MAEFGKWTRVEDGKPEEGALVLFCGEDVGAVGYWNGAAWVCHIGQIRVGEITHWMPWPEGPEENNA